GATGLATGTGAGGVGRAAAGGGGLLLRGAGVGVRPEGRGGGGAAGRAWATGFLDCKTAPHCLQRIGWLTQSVGMRRTVLHPGHFTWTTAGMADLALPAFGRTARTPWRSGLPPRTPPPVSRRHCNSRRSRKTKEKPPGG